VELQPRTARRDTQLLRQPDTVARDTSGLRYTACARQQITGFSDNRSPANVPVERPVYRTGTVECPPDNVGQYLDNGNFTLISGDSFYQNGRLDFTATDGNSITQVEHESNMDRTHSYRTRFGPCYSHSGVVYTNSDGNLAAALTRLTNSRFPSTPGLHLHYKAVQVEYLAKNQSFLAQLAIRYSPNFESYTDAFTLADDHHGDKHFKRLLRLYTYCKLHDDGSINHRLWLTAIKVKLKTLELAKYAKIPRLIGDLGVGASLQGFMLTMYLKEAMAYHPIHINGGTIEFIKEPAPATLERVFPQLINPPGRYYFCLFSDDSCFSIRHNGVVRRFNIDISKCDASHTDELFSAMIAITPEIAREDMSTLTSQCALDVVITSPVDRSKKVKLRPAGRFLASGSTLTTSINNLANILIGKALSECDFTGIESIIQAAARVGYLITVEESEFHEDIQFLKHSPVYDTIGVVRPLLNLGVLYRASGTIKGDLPGRGDISVRAKAFQSSLLRGAYPYANFEILDRMKHCHHTPNDVCDLLVARDLEYKVVRDDKYPHYTADEASLYRRYRLSPSDISDLLTFSDAGFQMHYGGDALDKVLLKDYGLISAK